MHKNVSVLISVYRNDKPEDFRAAIESVTIKQTLPPDEVVLVVDGPVPDKLADTIRTLSSEIPYIRPIRLEKNGGLGNALNIGMKECRNELVARMDADDISEPDRFEKQVSFMATHPEIAVCGGVIEEFINTSDNIVAKRKVPLSPQECSTYYQDRDPLNHMTVMLRKSAVLEVGNYLPWHLNEDSYLWGRLLKSGYKIANLPDVLVKVRVGEDMYQRRGGWKYFQSDISIVKWKLENGLTSRWKYAYNYAARLTIEVLMPNFIRGWIYKNILR